MLGKCKFCQKTGTPTVALQRVAELACSAAEILKLWITVLRDTLFKKEQRSYLHLGVPTWGLLFHAADLRLVLHPGLTAGLICKAGWNVWSALAVVFRFQRASGPGRFHGNRGGEAARLLASLTTQQERTCLGDRRPLFWGSTVESFQKKLGRPPLSADPEGLTGMEEILLQQEIEWAQYTAWYS